MESIDKVKTHLIESKSQLLEKLKNEVKLGSKYRKYETFGKEIEDFLVKSIVDILTEKRVISSTDDYHIAQNKNEFPDFVINSNPKIALEFKSGNHRKKTGSKWMSCNNSGNDMGTLNSWQDKFKKFNGENIYYLFIEYIMDDRTTEIVDVKIEPFYKFIGLNKDGFLKYREKDGNLRPKNFNEPSPITSFNQFEELFPKTIIYRAKRIIKHHIKSIPNDERNDFLDSLKI